MHLSPLVAPADIFVLMMLALNRIQINLSMIEKSMRTEAALQEMEHAIQTLQKEHAKTENTSEPLPVTRILLLHYPPFNENNAPSGFTDLMERYHVDICIFGHLHDQNSFKRIPSTFGTTKLELVSADYAEFKIQKIL